MPNLHDKALRYKRWPTTANHNNSANFSNSGFKDKDMSESKQKVLENH